MSWSTPKKAPCMGQPRGASHKAQPIGKPAPGTRVKNMPGCAPWSLPLAFVPVIVSTPREQVWRTVPCGHRHSSD